MSPPAPISFSSSPSTTITSAATTTTTTTTITTTTPTTLASASHARASSMSIDGRPNPGGRPCKPLPHINDLVSATPDIDVLQSIDAVLAHGEKCINGAESSKNFGRPDTALKEYVKATIVAVEYVPKNKDFPSLSSRRGLTARHQALMKKIQSLQPDFDRIKEIIKEDNRVSGVQPTVARPSSTDAKASSARAKVGPFGQLPNGAVNGTNGNGPGHSVRSGQEAAAASPQKGKPAIHPKPRALHGASVRPASAAGNKAAQDLMERFANLRGSISPRDLDNPSQSPTQSQAQFQQHQTQTQHQTQPQTQPQHQLQHPVAPQRPAKTRGTPAEAANITLISDFPDLPKVPEAIYSPARGTVSHEAANLPSSNSRGIFSRTVSTPSGATQAKSPPLNDDYFVPLQPPTGSPAPPAPPPPRHPRVVIPDGDTVTPEELVKFMKASSSGFKTLLIDVRRREEFDEGHIMSQSTICIEPEILQRENVAADEVADRMILSPTEEQTLFSRRSEFDLVVFYNQDALEINWRGGTEEETALLGLYNALRHFDYALEGESKPAKLLKGGIEGWVGLVGQSALKTSSTAPSAQGIGRPPCQAPRARPIQDPEVARQWEETLSSAESALVRNRDEFLRRYPSVSAIQESMTSPISKPEPEPEYPGTAEIYSSMPSPPARPAPTVPRQSYSGLRETGQEEHYASATVATAKTKEKSRSSPVGLFNPGVWCYGNSSIQALFHSFGFASDLVAGDWQAKWAVPRRAGETLNNPQLLTKIISNLFHWMDNGQFESMQCKTLMEYCCYVDSKQIVNGKAKGTGNALGSKTKQQDAGEFIIFVMDHIHDETNRLRNLTFDPSKVVCNGDRHEHALAHWKGYRGANDSIIDQYWRGLTQNVLRCSSCGHTTYNHEAWDKMQVTVPPPKGEGSSYALMDLLHKSYPDREVREDYRCDRCKERNTTTSTMRLARLPELLCITLGRFNQTEHPQQVTKTNTKVTYPIESLDLTEISDATPRDRAEGAEWEGPFRYYCYAAIMHRGELQGGHYTAYVRDQGADDDSSWYFCNDLKVERRKIDNDQAADKQGMYQEDVKTSAYILFYRRRLNPKMAW